MDTKIQRKKWWQHTRTSEPEKLDSTWDFEPLQFPDEALIEKERRFRESIDEYNKQKLYNQIQNQQNKMSPTYNYNPSYNPSRPEEPKDHRLVIFYGFNGMLAMKFSWLNGMSEQEIVARMQIAGDKIPYKVMFAQEFLPIMQSFKGTANALIEIPFDDAMNIIRIGVQEAPEEFIESEVDEFDDNCVETCRPGAHNCGK